MKILITLCYVLFCCGNALANDLVADIVTVNDKGLFKGSTTSKIENNPVAGRDELQIYSGQDAYSSNSTGAGIHLYGNNDSEHSGHFAVLTGPDNNGEINLIVTKSGETCVGNGIIDVVDDNKQAGLLNIYNPSGQPGLFIKGASTTEGDIAFPTGEYLSIGTYDGDTFKEIVRIRDQGLYVDGENVNDRLKAIEDKIEAMQ